jgi:hypothetical protein
MQRYQFTTFIANDALRISVFAFRIDKARDRQRLEDHDFGAGISARAWMPFSTSARRNGAVNKSLFPSNTGEKSWALWPD